MNIIDLFKLRGKAQKTNEERIIRRVIKKQEGITRKDIADWKAARLRRKC